MKAKMLISVIMSTVLLLLPCAFAQGAGKDCGRDPLCVFQTKLNQEGFVVTPGAVAVLNPLADWCEDKTSDAMCVNSEPYLSLKVPESAGVQNLIPDFKIGHDEAIVLIGLTPPPEKYFGFYSWVATKVYPDGTKEIFATLGDAVNNATVKTIGPTPFNAPVALIFTPDQRMDARARAALESAGYPKGIINTGQRTCVASRETF